MLHARPARVRARRRMTGIAMTTVALFALSACGGDPEAQETVGPTAGSDPSSTAQAYEPTLPPYTSDVDLTDEETEQVEDLLLLIDEFNILTGTLSEGSDQQASELSGSVDDDLLTSQIEGMTEAMEDGVRTRGYVTPRSAIVVDFSTDETVVSVCYDFSEYEIFEASNPGTALYPDRPTEHAYETTADRVDNKWILRDRTDSRYSCKDH